MQVTYGADYSAGELSPAELDQFTQYDIRFLLRYIGWPDNPKCISHYPGSYQALTGSGRMVLLAAELNGSDQASLPVFFCADGWLSANGIPVATAYGFRAYPGVLAALQSDSPPPSQFLSQTTAPN
jgi:hypothetical protein